MKILILMLVLVLSGCGSAIDSPEVKKEKADYKRLIFKECMKAAETQNNGVTSTVESEVSNTVQACATYANYTVNLRF